MLRLGDNVSDSREILVPDKRDAADDDVIASSSRPDVTSRPAVSRDEDEAAEAGVQLNVRGLSTGNNAEATNNAAADDSGTRSDDTVSSVCNRNCNGRSPGSESNRK